MTTAAIKYRMVNHDEIQMAVQRLKKFGISKNQTVHAIIEYCPVDLDLLNQVIQGEFPEPILQVESQATPAKINGALNMKGLVLEAKIKLHRRFNSWLRSWPPHGRRMKWV